MQIKLVTMNLIKVLTLVPVIFFFSFILVQAQDSELLKGANRIVIKNNKPADLNFKEMIGALLDNGYAVENKDNELLTVTTQKRAARLGAIYIFNLQAKDKEIILSGMYENTPDGAAYKVKGAMYPISNVGLGMSEKKKLFVMMNDFAKKIDGTLNYVKL